MSSRMSAKGRQSTALLRFGRLGVLLFLGFAAGCGGKSQPVVSGKVTVNGQLPVPGASVTFLGADNKQATASVNDQGVYNLTDPPLGEVQVVVKGPNVTAPIPKAQMPGAPSRGTERIPRKYEKPGNGLTYLVKPGNQQFDLSLTP
jgi:hypothetical protein